MKNPNNSTSITVADATVRYRATRFWGSVNALAQLPADTGWEVAIVGRSNAGKSSALNALTDQRQLARISKTPGRTQLINFFSVDADRYLVDLPGYGYAQAPDAVRRHWRWLLERYLRERTALRGLLLVVDIRRLFTDLDHQMLDWCAARRLPTHILLTKADKFSRGAGLAALQQAQRTLKKDYPSACIQLFSALTRLGVDEARAQLDQWLGYRDPTP